MKRFILPLLALLALTTLVRLPSPATDVGKLEPVSTVQIIASYNGVRIRTDTGAEGVGPNLASAVEDLHADTDAYVFLDTADYLLLTNVPDEMTLRLCDYFRPSCRVCTIRGTPDLSFAAQYLTVHPLQTTLNDLRITDD